MEKINLFSIRTIKNLLKAKDIKPSKGLGQNFLTSQKTALDLIRAAEISKQDIVLEIGPGIGNLTRELARAAKKVKAVEKDRKMNEILKETIKGFENVEVVSADALKIQSPNISYIRNNFVFRSQYKVVANIPYYITAPLIRMFLEMENPPKIMVLMVQKEVGQRICSKPPKMAKLAVFVQGLAEPKIVKLVKKESFWPKPKVDSAILKITPLPNSEIRKNKGLQKLFSTVVNAGFSQPRKKIIKNLSTGLKMEKSVVEKWLKENNIRPEQRAESLGVEDWINLVKTNNMFNTNMFNTRR